MNRWDEINGVARDVADWVCTDPARRDQMAADLIKLVGLMVQATGKGVAIAGECAMNDDQDGDPTNAARYLIGEDIQNGARKAVEESVDADIERYERDGLAPAWVSRRDKPRDGEASPVPADVVEYHTWGGKTLRPVPAPASCGAVDSGDLDACGVCPDCRRSQLKVVADPESSARSVFGPVRKWGRLPEHPQQDASQPSQPCGFIPGDAVPACDFDPNCPTHGILGKQP